jgi:hypothetical protein
MHLFNNRYYISVSPGTHPVRLCPARVFSTAGI